MIRPATPLSVVLLASLALLVLSIISSPIIKAIPLGQYNGNTYGVFGACLADGTCSSIGLGYDDTYIDTDSSAFTLTTGVRSTLSTVLVLHIVAAAFALLMLILAITAHFHSPSHSAKYLLALSIISVFAFLVAIVAFVIDVLLFIPHIAWGAYITLAAAVLLLLSSVVSCAMRRTLVSRKALRNRVGGNPEMSGENFYNRQAQEANNLAVSNAVLGTASDGTEMVPPIQPTIPSLDRKDTVGSEEQIPLTTQMAMSGEPYGYNNQGMSSDNITMTGAVPSAAVGAVGGGIPPTRPNRPPSLQRDGYGNVMPYGSMQRGPSMERMNNMSPAQRGRGGFRGGRGGGPGSYGPPGNAGYGRGGYGPPPGRGGYGGPMQYNNGNRGRGGYGGGYGPPQGRGGFAGSGRGSQASPPPGYLYEGANNSYNNIAGSRGVSPAPGNGNGNSYYGNGTPPPRSNSTGMNDANPANYEAYRPNDVEADLPRAESPPPLPDTVNTEPSVQAIEMDASSPSTQPGEQPGPFRESDADIAGLVGLQQKRTSEGEDGQYVPPRTNWNTSTPNASTSNLQENRSLSPPDEAAEARPLTQESYMEDIEPRFADQPAPGGLRPPPEMPQPLSSTPTPPPLATGGLAQPSMRPPLSTLQVPANSGGYDDTPQGARSPAESDLSNFTSISQRGINPRWNPPPPSMMGNGYGGPRRPPPQRDTNDMLLNTNPDFSLPGMGPTGRRGGRGGMRGGMRGGRGGGGMPGGNSMIPGSAYPAI